MIRVKKESFQQSSKSAIQSYESKTESFRFKRKPTESEDHISKKLLSNKRHAWGFERDMGIIHGKDTGLVSSRASFTPNVNLYQPRPLPPFFL